MTQIKQIARIDIRIGWLCRNPNTVSKHTDAFFRSREILLNHRSFHEMNPENMLFLILIGKMVVDISAGRVSLNLLF